MRTARKRQPGNGEVVERLARALSSRGQIDAAVTEASGALGAPSAGEMEPARRLSLSLMLAELEGARGNHRVAVAALRSVLDLGPDVVSERLGQALEAWRAAAAASGAAGELRAATLELIDRARRRGDVAGARRLIDELLATRRSRTSSCCGSAPSWPRRTGMSPRLSMRPTT